MADKDINNPGGAFGYTAAGDNLMQFGGYFKASAAITAGNVVIINTDGTISPAATGSSGVLCVGIAPKAIAAGANGYVVTHGVVDNAVAQGAIAAGDVVKRSATTAAAVAATSAPAVLGEAIGFAVAASASGVVTIFVSKTLATT